MAIITCSCAGIAERPLCRKERIISQTGDSGSEFPGLPPNLTGLSNSKGSLASYKPVLSSNLINSFRYGFIAKAWTYRPKKPALCAFPRLDNPQGFTTAAESCPVNNFVDDVTWTRENTRCNLAAISGSSQYPQSDSTVVFHCQHNVSWLDNGQ